MVKNPPANAGGVSWIPGPGRSHMPWGTKPGCHKYRSLCDALRLVAQPRPPLCHPVDCSPPGSSVHWDSPGKNTGVGCHALLQGIFPTRGSNPRLPHCRRVLYHLSHRGSPRILEWVAYPFSRRSCGTQESNWGLLHFRRVLYQLSYQGIPTEALGQPQIKK